MGSNRGRPSGIFWLGGEIFLPVGLVLFGIATIKTKVLPPWGRALPVIIALTQVSGMMLGGLRRRRSRN